MDVYGPHDLHGFRSRNVAALVLVVEVCQAQEVCPVNSRWKVNGKYGKWKWPEFTSRKSASMSFHRHFGHEKRRNPMKAIGIATITFFTNVGNSQCHLHPQKTNENHRWYVHSIPSHAVMQSWVVYLWHCFTHMIHFNSFVVMTPDANAGTTGTPDVSSQGLSATSRSA